MIGSLAWRALMRRNLIYRKRNIIGTVSNRKMIDLVVYRIRFLLFIEHIILKCIVVYYFFLVSAQLCELLFPIVFVLFLVLIKSAVEDNPGFTQEIIPAYFPNNSDALVAFSFTDYVTALQADRVCETISAVKGRTPQGQKTDLGITGIESKGYNWQVPFVKCDSRKCEENGQDALPFCQFLALGIAPSSEEDEEGQKQASAFRNYIYNRYPNLGDKEKLPFDFDFVQSFASDNDIETYVTEVGYGADVSTPKLALAVVFDGTDSSINYNYKIRVNSTGFNSPEDEARPATTTTPPTDKLFESLAKDDSETCPDLVGGMFIARTLWLI